MVGTAPDKKNRFLPESILSLLAFIIFTGSLVSAVPDSTFTHTNNNKAPNPKWIFHTKAPIFASPVVNDSVVYVGGLDSLLHAINLLSGKEKWKFKTGAGIRASVCINKDRLFLNGGDGRMYCLRKDSGKLIWKFKTHGEKKYDFADYFQSTPVCSKEVLYFGSGDGNFYAVDIEREACSGSLKPVM
jgi:eukaryotic-like serine/threonine-protein kinase